MFDKTLRIGTRDSQLALWQAHKVGDLLEASHLKTQLVATKSAGDLNLTQPIYAMGIQGVFTKALDIALLENRIDLAVHSLKDVPTQLPEGLVLVAVLERGSASDVLVQTHKADLQQASTIATGSLRRKAQWLHRYPHHHLVNLRGNVQTRMDKLFSSNWEGAIFARAGLERAELLGSHFQELKWMIPAPAQGAIGVVCRVEDTELIELLKKINHQPTRECVDIERDFLRILEGGCSAPIGAHAVVAQDKIQFKGGVFSLDGQIAATTSKEVQ
ncbi:MAG: hydroxymethylbilane synthase, partial [Flavobacteriaceae bacterium]